MEYTEELKAWEDQFYNALVGKKLTDINFVQVNPQYFAFDEERVWVLDGGVELTTSEQKTITYGWNKTVELMDLQLCEPSELLADLDYYALEAVSEKVKESLTDKEIEDVEFEWNWYQMLNEDFELEEKLHYAPLGVTLKFTDNQTLQLASIRFQLQGQSLANAYYLPEGDLLVSLNEIIPIILNEDEAE